MVLFGGPIMTKTSTLHIRIETDLKDNVEHILAQLGMTSAEAVRLFFKQVELQGGLPFELKVPQKVLAEQKLFDGIEDGRASAEKQGFMSLNESKNAILK